jgi:hypothetical protein
MVSQQGDRTIKLFGFGISDFGNVGMYSLIFPSLSNVPLDKRQDLVLLLPMLYEFLFANWSVRH